MKKVVAFLIVVALCALALPSLFVVSSQNTSLPAAKLRRLNKPIAGQYIVVLKKTADAVPSLANDLTQKHGGQIKYVYENALKGFALQASEAEAMALSRDARVNYVEEAGEVVVTGVQSPIVTDSSTFWGLDRIDQIEPALDSAYHYNRVGSGVHVYVIDTGVRLTQQEFGTRATAVYDFGRSSSDPAFGFDSFNHGTFVAGVIGGKTYGVAKNALIHSVRVLAGGSNGNTQDLVNGINFVAANHIKPAVANISLAVTGSCSTTSVDTAVQSLINSGVTVVVGAGDQNADAGCTSPAHLASAITVGSSTSGDARSSNSNFGSSLDIFAPGAGSGQFIPTASNASDSGLDGFSATSAAAPHVAGVAALYLEQFSVNNPNDSAASPASVSAAIINNATVNKLSSIGSGSPNRLLYSGFVTAAASNPINETRFFVRQQYYDFMRRQPDSSGWDFHTNNINSCGTDAACLSLWRATTVRGFMESPEFRNAHTILRDNAVGSQAYNEEFIRQLYRCTLQREADAGGLAYHMDFINTYPGSYTGLIAHFIESPEYLQRFQ
jgi:subtilisin family serine protease